MILLTVKDVAAALNVSDRKAAKMLRSGSIPGFRLRELRPDGTYKLGPWRTTRAQLYEYISQEMGIEYLPTGLPQVSRRFPAVPRPLPPPLPNKKSG